ncbi:hypothetical protein AcV7_002432 [Taiwanofungus camphoratus]|nr:hypothetical protein AcV7_002432 [Antrodia cinnamomea]
MRRGLAPDSRTEVGLHVSYAGTDPLVPPSPVTIIPYQLGTEEMRKRGPGETGSSALPAGETRVHRKTHARVPSGVCACPPSSTRLSWCVLWDPSPIGAGTLHTVLSPKCVRLSHLRRARSTPHRRTPHLLHMHANSEALSPVLRVLQTRTSFNPHAKFRVVDAVDVRPRLELRGRVGDVRAHTSTSIAEISHRRLENTKSNESRQQRRRAP